MRIGEYIKYKRQSLGYSQAQFAERLEISKQAVSKWEKGAALPDMITMIPRIAYVLNVEPERLMNFIWMGETSEHITYFISINVKEKKSSYYMIKIYEFDNFLRATEMYDKICAGQIESDMQTLIDYYNYNSCRRFSVEFWESIYITDGEEPIKTLVIESTNLNSLITSHIQKDENTKQ